MDNQPTICCGAECRSKQSLFQLTDRVSVFPHLGAAPHWPVDTPGGRFYAEFDPETPISREGQLVFFAQFLQTGQRWERFLKNCPLTYTGNRGSKVVNVLGTAFISFLAGHLGRKRM